ncbi:hypothetical protein ATL39_3103 [Sinobaca qinghaiensis]|uniref:Uncharacterized protein n=1 Tax=Sinobaca qinghaiensis TaxID=342944 RepID=A0A419UX17_9BACL|nr:hypothetical protein [Sinobaca qinghaiensis]RKD69677.1 hypothetical protein ATL39_3103 [Sinobaca qinghaiensis]
MKGRTSSYKPLRIPTFLHELFGKETTKPEAAFILLSSIIIPVLLLSYTYEEWLHLSVLKIILLVVLAVDLSGGVTANVTKSTNDYYQAAKRAGFIFIAVHIQPLILGWLLGNFLLGLGVWIGSAITALIILNLDKHIQRTAGMSAALCGITFVMLVPNALVILKGLLALYIFKLVFSFAVNHTNYRR